MKTKLIPIGNSRGVRLPKPLLEEVGLHDEVDLRVEGEAIVLRPVRGPRAGWGEAARRLADQGGDQLLDPYTSSRFDEEEWQW